MTDNPLRDVQTLKGVVSCHEVMSNSVLNRWLSRRSDQELALRDTGDARIKSNIISLDLETQLLKNSTDEVWIIYIPQSRES